MYIWPTISSCYGPITLALGLIVIDGALSTLCESCEFACQQRVLKTFPGSGYIHSEDSVVWPWHALEYLYVWLTISSCYGPINLAWGLIVRDDGLSPLCHSCRFDCQKRVLKTFPWPDSFNSDDGVVWLWHPLVNLHIWLTISPCYGSIVLALVLIVRDVGLNTVCLSCGLACQQRVMKRFLPFAISTPSMG